MPFYRELVKQTDLAAQFRVLENRKGLTPWEMALHLARFAEAHVCNAAQAEIDKLEKEIARLKKQFSPRRKQALVTIFDYAYGVSDKTMEQVEPELEFVEELMDEIVEEMQG